MQSLSHLPSTITADAPVKVEQAESDLLPLNLLVVEVARAMEDHTEIFSNLIKQHLFAEAMANDEVRSTLYACRNTIVGPERRDALLRAFRSVVMAKSDVVNSQEAKEPHRSYFSMSPSFIHHNFDQDLKEWEVRSAKSPALVGQHWYAICEWAPSALQGKELKEMYPRYKDMKRAVAYVFRKKRKISLRKIRDRDQYIVAWRPSLGQLL
ncbi:hypothetical protein BDV97DRAFT_399912 [Delphinella strobiligena]|nr:hypothetical protein BDV97DRAFT_399912 [Delphinella strobiligena]